MNPAAIDLLLAPGELSLLLSSLGLSPAAGSPLAEHPCAEAGSSTRPVSAITSGIAPASLRTLMQTIVAPDHHLAGRRGERCGAPWPFLLLGRSGAWAVLAPEPDLSVRIRFPFTSESLLDWIAKPFEPIGTPATTLDTPGPLRPDGLGVVLALAEVLRIRKPEFDPEFIPSEPITFSLDEVADILRGSDPTSLISGARRLGILDEAPPSPDDIAGLLYLLVNEGHATADVSGSEPIFALGPDFVWTAMHLCWWDLSLALENPGGEALRVIQAHAVWQFERGKDERWSMKPISGSDLRPLAARLLGGSPSSPKVVSPPVRPGAAEPKPSPREKAKPAAPTPRPSVAAPVPTSKRCSKCGAPVAAGARFCGKCGAPVEPAKADASRFCPQCGKPLTPGAAFCGGCGRPVRGN